MRIVFNCLLKIIKCPYSQKAFLGFGIPITSKNVFKSKTVNSDAFYHKIKLWISCFGHAQWSWPCNEDWWRMMSLQEYFQAFCLYFASLTTALLHQLQFVCFLSRKTPHQQLLKLEGFCDSWHDVTTHSETQTLFCTDSRSTSLGVAEAWTLKLDPRALKSRNPTFFLRIPFYTL